MILHESGSHNRAASQLPHANLPIASGQQPMENYRLASFCAQGEENSGIAHLSTVSPFLPAHAHITIDGESPRWFNRRFEVLAWDECIQTAVPPRTLHRPPIREKADEQKSH
jgi:hypothetical protein